MYCGLGLGPVPKVVPWSSAAMTEMNSFDSLRHCVITTTASRRRTRPQAITQIRAPC